MTGLVLVALIPFAALGIALGHLLNDDAMGPAIGGGASLFAFLGGTWFPLTGGGAFVDVLQVLPSYWLVQAGHVGLGGERPVGRRGLDRHRGLVGGAAPRSRMWAYRRDTTRV